MKAIIHRIVPNSPAAAQPALQPGQVVVAVNGCDTLEDLFDYQFEQAGCETLRLDVLQPDGGRQTMAITKPADDDAGIHFTSPLFTPIKTCNNGCPFCFIDQQPEGLRASLYVKDDDYRLSYFNGTYITLTNLTERDKVRIERIRPGPLYVSVHATAPDVRAKLLKNPKAPPILDVLRWLKSLDIAFHAQVVLCPGINDGEVLSQTLAELAPLRPALLSVAVVPVGLTRHREALPQLRPVDVETAQDVIARVERLSDQKRRSIAFASDEFYLMAGQPLPEAARYGPFPQLDDGVGMTRMLLEDFWLRVAPGLPDALPQPHRVLLMTGALAAQSLQPIVGRINQVGQCFVDLMPVTSHFWGQAVTVAGLLTASDLWEALAPLVASGEMTQYNHVVIPSVMLRHGFERMEDALFLDGETVAGLSARVGRPFRVVQDTYSAAALVACLLPSPPETALAPTVAPGAELLCAV
jgi:putative radical SAM enzyme (TIGR03279 family)